MDRKPILSVEDLAVSFHTSAGEVQAVRGVTWHVNEQETIAIVGESGCGKTVTIQTVLGLNSQANCEIKSGSIRLNDEELIGKTSKELRELQGKSMSIIFQDPFTFLDPTMTVGKQIMEGYIKHNKVTKEQAKKRTLEIMRMISIPDPEITLKKYPHQLSGGLRQRVMIAIALICGPQILFADEPTTALDVTVQAQIIELMNSLKKDINSSIILITHDMGVVANMADRIYVMYAGKIMEHGYARDIFYHAKHPYTAGLLKSAPRLDVKRQGEQYSIPGTPPDLVNPPQGCPFAARCPHTMQICVEEAPEYIQFDHPEHYAACWLNHPACIEAMSKRGE